VQGEQGPSRGCPPRARVAAKRDGHPRQNPAYRPATEKALETGLFLLCRFCYGLVAVRVRQPLGGFVEPLGAGARPSPSGCADTPRQRRAPKSRPSRSCAFPRYTRSLDARGGRLGTRRRPPSTRGALHPRIAHAPHPTPPPTPSPLAWGSSVTAAAASSPTTQTPGPTTNLEPRHSRRDPRSALLKTDHLPRPTVVSLTARLGVIKRRRRTPNTR